MKSQHVHPADGDSTVPTAAPLSEPCATDPSARPVRLSPLTPWFPAEVTPVRPGVYEVAEGGRSRAFAYWDGLRFGWRCWDYPGLPDPVEDAFWMRRAETCLPERRSWRGLAKKP